MLRDQTKRRYKRHGKNKLRCDVGTWLLKMDKPNSDLRQDPKNDQRKPFAAIDPVIIERQAFSAVVSEPQDSGQHCSLRWRAGSGDEPRKRHLLEQGAKRFSSPFGRLSPRPFDTIRRK